MKNINIIGLIIFIGIATGCHSILDVENLSAVSEEDVWNDPLLAEAYVNKIYADNLPGWDRGIANNSDESNGGDSYMYGQLTENSVNYWPYGQIRNINTLFAEIDNGSLDDAIKDKLKGEAHFFRAWRYFELVKRYGGIPIILEPQELTDDLLVERNSTAEVIERVIQDIDAAIDLLPEVSAESGDNDGRVHKGTALAIKGRFLLNFASPQFNPENDSEIWEAAYSANKAAKNYLNEMGFGLFEDFSGLWINEMNKEALFVQRYLYPNNIHNWSAGTRPLDMSQGASNSNQPTWEMVQAFPMIDGRPIDGHPEYDELYYWQNRDPRFAATIAYNGCVYELSGLTGRIQYTYIGSEVNSPTQTGFYCRKGIDESQTAIEAYQSGTDWIELRYAEVLLNLAEAANATGRSAEAYEELIAIRTRAGIEPGLDNLYGLEPLLDRGELHKVILDERRVEFAFEAKRHWDLRRNRLFEEELNGTRRHGLRIDLKEGVTEDQLVGADLEQDYDQYFEHEEILVDLQFDINWREEYYFYAIPQQHLQLNSHLEQTLGWPGGTFDPLP